MPPEWTLTDAQPLFTTFDDRRPGHGLRGVNDPDVHLRDGRWTMLMCGLTSTFAPRIVEARLPAGADVSDDRWELVTDDRGRAVEIGKPGLGEWDALGQHSPSYVRGTVGGREVERVYYAAQLSARTSGPRSRWAIGFLQRVDGTWHGGAGPVLVGDGERPGVMQPIVVADEGRWRMWFLSVATGEVGRGEQPDYELRYAESDDGVFWDEPEPFASTEEGFFGGTVLRTAEGWQMLLSRGTNLYGTEPFPGQGLWLTAAAGAPAGRGSWAPLHRILDTDERAEPWYASGVSGPSAVLEGEDRLHVFVTATHAPVTWRRAAADRLRQRRRPPLHSPFQLTTARLTFRR